ncbi:hypothetical protein A0257_11730 [Hymenobacter psoromatis]|nr:hypothetical protein A0257_11730 [Hymenobacter psoromatis]
MVRNTFTLFFENETAVLAQRHARHLDRASDKRLYLAERLSELSQELHPFVRMLRDARAGNTWLSKLLFEFDPRPLANAPRTTSQSLARALHFRVLLDEYEGYKMPVVTDKLSLRQVALLHIYEGRVLDSTEAVKAAAKAGYSSRTSGQKLMQYYNALAHHTTNRIRLEGKALSDMIKDIARVVALLSGTAREQAESELKTLQARK